MTRRRAGGPRWGSGAGGALTLTALAIERRAPITAMRELVTASRALWSGEVVDRDGVVGGFRRARLDFGRPDIPIWVAGRGPRVMRLAGELADGFIMSFVHKELIGEHVAAIRGAADEHDRPHPRLCYMTILATTEAARQSARASLTFRLVDSPDTVKARIGLDPATEAAIRRGLADGGPASRGSSGARRLGRRLRDLRDGGGMPRRTERPRDGSRDRRVPGLGQRPPLGLRRSVPRR